MVDNEGLGENHVRLLKLSAAGKGWEINDKTSLNFNKSRLTAPNRTLSLEQQKVVCTTSGLNQSTFSAWVAESQPTKLWEFGSVHLFVQTCIYLNDTTAPSVLV